MNPIDALKLALAEAKEGYWAGRDINPLKLFHAVETYLRTILPASGPETSGVSGGNNDEVAP